MRSPYCTPAFCREILTQLVSVDSTQPLGNERRMVDRILSFFPADIRHTRLIHSAQRQSLVIEIPGRRAEGGIAFVGHLDTVSFGDAALWRYPPLSAAEDGDFLYGRGTADMKGGDTAMIAAALSVLHAGGTPEAPLYFCFTADEENGGLGARALTELEPLSQVEEFWVAEPSARCIGVCEKGALWLGVTARGKLSHASRPELGVNSIDWLMWLYEKLRSRICAGDHRDPYLGAPTVSVTKLSGGIATNIIPDFAEMELDIRTLPGMSHAQLVQYAEDCAAGATRVAEGLSMELRVLNDRPAAGISDTAPLVRRIETVCARQGWQPKKKGIYFYTDASQLIPVFQKPFVIMGPGDDAMAHQLDERIRLQDVAEMAQLYTDYLEARYLGGSGE